MSSSGCRWYCAVPKWGKTHRALEDAAELMRATGYPLLVIDSSGARNLRWLHHAQTVAETISRVWNLGEPTAFMPRDLAHLEVLLHAVERVGRVVLLVDDSAEWLSSNRGRAGPLVRLMRRHQHHDVWILCTTQHFTGDVSQEALACEPELYVGRTSSPAALEALERRYGIPPEAVRALASRQFLRVDEGLVSPSARGTMMPVEPSERASAGALSSCDGSPEAQAGDRSEASTSASDPS